MSILTGGLGTGGPLVTGGLAGTSSPIPMPAPDMMAAVVDRLRATSNVVTALTEDTTVAGGTKIWADDQAFGQPDPPYLTYSEPRGNKVYQFGGNYYEAGTFLLSIIGTGKESVRTISQTVVNSLNDKQNILFYVGGQFCYLREEINSAPPTAIVSPNSPTTYKRVVTMRYIVAGTI